MLLGVSNESAGESASHQLSESAEGHVESGSESSETTGAAVENNTDRTVLGINTESNAAGATALAISVLLAALLVLVDAHAVVVAVAVCALAFTVFDIAEVVHQIDVSESSLAVLAVAVTLAHLGAGGLAAALTRLAVRPARAC